MGGIKRRDRNEEIPEDEADCDEYTQRMSEERLDKQSMEDRRYWQKEKRKTEIKMEGQW